MFLCNMDKSLDIICVFSTLYTSKNIILAAIAVCPAKYVEIFTHFSGYDFTFPKSKTPIVASEIVNKIEPEQSRIAKVCCPHLQTKLQQKLNTPSLSITLQNKGYKALLATFQACYDKRQERLLFQA